MESENSPGASEGLILTGEIKRYNRAASGIDSGGLGTIAPQLPFFISQGVKRARECYPGTINISIAPDEFEILEADYCVWAAWVRSMPNFIEKFWLVDMTLKFKEKCYPAYLYYPRESDIKAHKINNVIEVLTEKIPGLNYGDIATVVIPPGKVRLKPR